MKKLMMMMVMAAFCLTTNAQNTQHENGSFTLQPMVGVGFGALGGHYYTTGSTKKVDDKMRVGLVAGVEGEYFVSDWFTASAGVMYAMQGWRVNDNGSKWNMNLDFINIPVLANFYVTEGLALKVGVQPGFLVSAKADGSSSAGKDYAKKFSLAVPVGVSYEFENGLTFDFRANFALTKINKIDIPSVDDDTRSNLLQLTVGYKFEL